MTVHQAVSPVIDGATGEVVGEWRGFAFSPEEPDTLTVEKIRRVRI